MTPDTETVVDAGDTTAEKTVRYTVSNPVEDTTHTIALHGDPAAAVSSEAALV